MSSELGVTDGAFDKTIEEDVVDQAIDEMTSGYQGRYLRIYHAPWVAKLNQRHLLKIEVNGHLLILSELTPGRSLSAKLPYEIVHNFPEDTPCQEGGNVFRSQQQFHHLSQALRRFAELVEEQKF